MKKLKFILAILAILFSFQVEAQKTTKSNAQNLSGYASFGEKFTPNKVISKDAMLKKYKNLKKVYVELPQHKKLLMDYGIEKGKIEVARNLLSLGLDIDKIVKATGLSEEDIKKLLS